MSLISLSWKMSLAVGACAGLTLLACGDEASSTGDDSDDATGEKDDDGEDKPTKDAGKKDASTKDAGKKDAGKKSEDDEEDDDEENDDGRDSGSFAFNPDASFTVNDAGVPESKCESPLSCEKELKVDPTLAMLASLAGVDLSMLAKGLIGGAGASGICMKDGTLPACTTDNDCLMYGSAVSKCQALPAQAAAGAGILGLPPMFCAIPCALK